MQRTVLTQLLSPSLFLTILKINSAKDEESKYSKSRNQKTNLKL